MAMPIQVRVTLADTWATSTMDARADESVRSLKQRVLDASRIPAERGDGYEVKHGGVPVKDESRSLSALGIKTGAALIVLSKRRRPVR
jgi:hypothetical protein